MKDKVDQKIKSVGVYCDMKHGDINTKSWEIVRNLKYSNIVIFCILINLFDKSTVFFISHLFITLLHTVNKLTLIL